MNKPTSDTKDPHRNYSPWLAVAVIMLSFSLILSNEVFARWVTDSFGSDAAQVAVFAFSANSNSPGNLSIDVAQNETTAEYSFTVLNQENGVTAQVPIKYEIDLTLPKSLPQGITLSIDGIMGSVSEDGLTYTFSDPSWTFSAFASASRDHLLVFTVDSSVAADSLSISGIGLSITSEQIQ